MVAGLGVRIKWSVAEFDAYEVVKLHGVAKMQH